MTTASLNNIQNFKLSAKLKPQISSLLSYRIMIFLRFILAIFGGYYLAAMSAICLSEFFSEDHLRAKAVFVATMLSIIIHGFVFIMVFMTKSTSKAWFGVLIPSLIVTVIFWLIKG